MLTVEYDSSGTAYPDDLAEVQAARMARCGGAYRASTSNVITAIRALIAEGRLDHNEVQFVYRGQFIWPNEYGAIPAWPSGFCAAEGRLVDRIIEGAMKKRREKR